MQVNVHEAKTQLSRLLQRVEGGEEIVIARNGHPVAKLVRVEQRTEPRVPGGWEGLWIADDFDAHDAEIERMFHGEDDADAAEPAA